MTDKTDTGERAVGKVVAGKARPAATAPGATRPPWSTTTSKKSWRDSYWMPESTSEPSLDELLTRQELLQRLDGRVGITERTLQLWEAAGVLPGPVRRRRDGATRALYAPWVGYLAALVGLSRDGSQSLEELAEMAHGIAPSAIHYFNSRTWDVLREEMPMVMTTFADRYQDATGERPAFAEVRFRREDGQTLDVYYVDINARDNRGERSI